MRLKTIFKPEELNDAVIQMYKLRLVHGWTGCLSLWHVPNNKLVIMQYPSSSSFIREATLITEIEDSFSWSDFLNDSGIHEEKNHVLLDVEECATHWHEDFAKRGIKTHNGHYIVNQKDKAWFFDILDTNWILENVRLAALGELENSQAKKKTVKA